jgi:hypothetical protein
MTLAELRALITDDLIDNRLTVAQINRAINDAINFYERKEFYFNQTASTTESYVSVPIVANQEYYSSPSIPDYVRITYIEARIGGSQITLNPFQDADIAEVQNGQAQGLPRAFTYVNQKLRIYPVPTSSGTMLIQATTKGSDLTSDSQSNVWTIEAVELIRQSAKRRLAINILHDTDLAGIIAPMEQEAYDGLLAESRRRNAQRKLYTPADIAGIWSNNQWGWNSVTGGY